MDLVRASARGSPSAGGPAARRGALGKPMRHAPPLILLFFIADAVLALLYLLNWALDRPSYTLSLLLDLDGEANLPTWYSSMQLFLIAFLMAAFARGRVDRTDRSSWVLAAWPATFVVLSIDEVASIHEWLGARGDILLPYRTRERTLFGVTGIWMFVFGIPILLFMFGLARSLKKYLRSSAAVSRRLWIALLFFFGGALGIEALSNFVADGSVWHMLAVLCEELSEMVGETFFLWVAYELLVSSGTCPSKGHEATHR